MFTIILQESKHEYGEQSWGKIQVNGKNYDLIIREYDNTCGMQKFYLRDNNGVEVYYTDGIAKIDKAQIEVSRAAYDEDDDSVEITIWPDETTDWGIVFMES